MDELSPELEKFRLLRRSQALSIAFSRRFGRGILLLVDDDKALYNPYTRDRIDHVVKVFVVVDDVMLLDISGMHDRMTFDTRYLRTNATTGSYRFIPLAGESQLGQFVSPDWDYPLSPIDDDEIDAVFVDFSERFPDIVSNLGSDRFGPAPEIV
jgi:hypothetical protein